MEAWGLWRKTFCAGYIEYTQCVNILALTLVLPYTTILKSEVKLHKLASHVQILVHVHIGYNGMLIATWPLHDGSDCTTSPLE